MKEAIFILLIVAVLFALTAFRYRRHLRTAIGVWRMLQSARSTGQRREVSGSEQPKSGKLVSCSKCGTWVPEPRAIRVPPKIYYCSRECLEQLVPIN